MRISDIRTVSEANIRDGVLTYVSQKTSTAASVPCGNRLAGWIRQANDCCEYVSLAGYNKALRRLYRRAGINSLTKVFSAGKTETGEKWMFVSSHTARISFATNLAECGAPLLSISRLCGHSSTSMTQRYIVTDKVTLNDRAMEYLNK